MFKIKIAEHKKIAEHSKVFCFKFTDISRQERHAGPVSKNIDFILNQQIQFYCLG